MAFTTAERMSLLRRMLGSYSGIRSLTAEEFAAELAAIAAAAATGWTFSTAERRTLLQRLAGEYAGVKEDATADDFGAELRAIAQDFSSAIAPLSTAERAALLRRMAGAYQGIRSGLSGEQFGVELAGIVDAYGGLAAAEPLEIFGASNIREWWRADQGITQLTGTVTSWAGIVNGTLPAGTGVAAEQPTFVVSAVNGQPGIQGDGVQRRIGHNAQPVLPAPGTSPTFFWAVAVAHSHASGRRLVDGWAATYQAVIQTGTSPGIGVNNSSSVVALDPPAIDEPFLITCEYSNNSTDRLRLNNSITRGNAGNASGSGIRIFRNGAGNYGHFTLCEIGYAIGLPTSDQLDQLYRYVNERYDLGIVSEGPTLVFGIGGQSNGDGYAPAPFYVPSPAVDNAAYMHQSSGNIVSPLVDPVGGIGGSFIPRMAEYLRSLGVTNPLLFVPCAIESTTSTQWVNTHATTMITRMHTAMALGPSILGGIIIYQGESDAQNAGVAALHASNWDSIYTRFNSEFGGYTWAKTARYWHVELPDTIPTGGSPAWSTAWNSVKAQQQVLTVGRADVEGVKPVWAGTDVHLDMAAQQALGEALAIAWTAAT